MKINWIKPVAEGVRAFSGEVTRIDISIPDSIKNSSDFFKVMLSKIEKCMEINSVHCVKIVYGEELPEYQVYAYSKESILDSLMVIVESCEKKKLQH